MPTELFPHYSVRETRWSAKARTPAQGIASLATTPSTFVLRESATTRTGERRRRVSGTSQFGQRDRGREAPHRGPRSGVPAARR